MTEKFVKLVAKELDLFDYDVEGPTKSSNEVTTLALKDCCSTYRVFVVKDKLEDSQEVEEAAKLAAFYNSQFVHRIFTLNKLFGPFGKHIDSFQIDDDQELHSVFVVKVDRGKQHKSLNLNELCTAAQAVAQFHYINERAVSPEVFAAINDNHLNIRDYDLIQQRKCVILLQEALGTTDRLYFKNPEDIINKVNYLMSRCQNEEPDTKSPTGDFVLCHGKLNASACSFSHHELKEISNWENVHFSDHAKDLTHLIISSADPEVRRNHYLKVFRQYYYALVDVRPPKFDVEVLRDLYLKYQKHVVISEMEALLYELSTDNDEGNRKSFVRRWEAALEDAYNFESNEYISDNEDCLFSK